MPIEFSCENVFVDVHQEDDPLACFTPLFALVQQVSIKHLLWGTSDIVKLHVTELLLIYSAQPIRLSAARSIRHHDPCGVGGIAVERP